MEQKQIQQNAKDIISKDVLLHRFAELKDQEKELKSTLEAHKTICEGYLNMNEIDEIENDYYRLKRSESTPTIVDASDVLKTIGIKLTPKQKEMVDELLSANVTNAKKILSAMDLNKIAKAGKTSTRMDFKKK